MPSLPPAAARASASATRQACSTASTPSAICRWSWRPVRATSRWVPLWRAAASPAVTRTITGRILRNTAYLKRQLRDIFTPGATGRLTVAGKYYCDAEVQRCPAISAANLWPTFSFQLYCPNPYWRSVSETSASLFYTQPAFRLPSAIAPTSSVCASSRIFSSSATPARTRRILC